MSENAIQQIFKKVVKVSTIAALAAAKVSILTSLFSLAILITLKWNIPIYEATALLFILGGIFTAFIYYSGWVRIELEYNADLADLRSLHKKVDRIEKLLEERK
jgi:membrane protein YdbS with pleckstrin-like domain